MTSSYYPTAWNCSYDPWYPAETSATSIGSSQGAFQSWGRRASATPPDSPTSGVSVMTRAQSAPDFEDIYLAESLVFLSKGKTFYRPGRPPCGTPHTTIDNNTVRTCQLCGTTKTPLWRRSQLYQVLCNACGIRIRSAATAKKK